jgi:hypothetical protein
MLTRRSRITISGSVKAIVGGARGAVRAIMVSHMTRQLTMQNTATKFTSRSAARNFASSPRQPAFRILWKSSIFQRIAYQRIFSTACSKLPTSKSVRNFHTIGFRPEASEVKSTSWFLGKAALTASLNCSCDPMRRSANVRDIHQPSNVWWTGTATPTRTRAHPLAASAGSIHSASR